MPLEKAVVEVDYELTWRDFLSAIKLTRPRIARYVTWFLAVFALAAVVGEVILLVVSIDNPELQRKAFSLIPLAVVAAFWWFLAYFGIYLSAKKQFRNSPSSQVPINLVVSDEGLRFKTSLSESKTSWKSFIKYSENAEVFAIRPSPVIFNVIPKRAFAEEQLKVFREMLERNIPGKR